MSRNRKIVEQYRQDMDSEILLDRSRNSWGVDEWHGFYLSYDIAVKDFDLTRRDIFNIFGVIKGEYIIAVVRTNYPELADQLKVTEGGVNVNHPDFDIISGELVSGGTVSQEDVDLIKALSLKQEQRWQIKGLPELKIGHIQSALRGV